MVDYSLVRQEVNETISRRLISIEANVGVARPGGELGKNAGRAGVTDAVTDVLHMLVDMTEKDASQPLLRRPQRLV